MYIRLQEKRELSSYDIFIWSLRIVWSEMSEVMLKGFHTIDHSKMRQSLQELPNYEVLGQVNSLLAASSMHL